MKNDIDSFSKSLNDCISKVEMLLDIFDKTEGRECEKIFHELKFIQSYIDDSEYRKNLSRKDTSRKTADDNSPLDYLRHDILEKLEKLKLTFLQEDLNMDFSKENVFHKQQIRGQIINISNTLKNLNIKAIMQCYDVLRHLSGHNKTLIIIGPNGSGKTSLANYLKQADGHVKVIPASKPIRYKGSMYSNYSCTIDSYNNEIYSMNAELNEDLLQKLIIGICTENDNLARAYYNNGEKEESVFCKIKIIFDELFDVKLCDTNFAAKEIMATKESQKPFAFNNMSDGERAAFFYIATVIVAPEKSFVIVDEPENHLNPAIYNKIWDRLIEIRKDCQFIFISHTLDFIDARTNYELVKISDYKYPNTFHFDFLGEAADNLKMESIIEIVGSRKPIIFCEGPKNSFDYKIYEILFGKKYTIIPTGTCEQVIESVVVCNNHKSTYNFHAAIGIIDSDLKREAEINKLKKKGIIVLKCNEIEMLLLDKDIFFKVLNHLYKDASVFENFKNEFFCKIEERKDYIIKRICKTLIDESINSFRIDDKNNKTKEDFKKNIDTIIGNVEVDKTWTSIEKRVDEILSDADYDSALRICCLEHREILGGVLEKFIPDYVNVAMGLLRDDSELAVHIRKEYFEGIVY